MGVGVMIVGVLMLGVIAMAGGPPSQPPAATGDAPPQGGGAGEGGNPPAIRDGMTAAEVQELLHKESDRLDMKLKSDREKLYADAKAEAKREADDEKKKADMSEIERAQAEKTAAESKLKALEEQLAQTQSAAARATFIASNAGDLDRAWRVYLDQELAAGEPDKADEILARVRSERDQENGRPGAPVGSAGRPAGPQGAPATGNAAMNQAIRHASGRPA